MTGRWHRVGIAALAAQLAACSTAATIHRQRSAPLEGRIVGSDENALVVRDATGATDRLPRPAVADIDHPGNVLAAAGAGLLLLGAVIAAGGPQTPGELTATGVVVGVPAVVMIGWGGTTYLRSKRAAARFQDETIRIQTPDPARPYLPAPIWSSPALSHDSSQGTPQ